MAPRAQSDRREAAVIWVGVNDEGERLDIYRRESASGLVHAAARIHGARGTRAERATIYRLAAAVEESMEGNAPVCIALDFVGAAFVYIEDSGTPFALADSFATLENAAQEEGFFPPGVEDGR